MFVKYLLFRFIRKITPHFIESYMIRRNIILKAGIETSNPEVAFRKYEKVLKKYRKEILNSNVLIFGYGGYFGIAIEFLKMGAKHIYLYDKYAVADKKKNKLLLLKNKKFLYNENHKYLPNKDYITIVNKSINNNFYRNINQKMDVVVSTSVLEHVLDIENSIEEFAKITKEDGINIHLIDIRDHYFKYPFHMLCFSKIIWNNFLNNENNLNRLRFCDYGKLFRKYFKKVDDKIISKDENAFKKIKSKIRKEFLTGDDKIDNITEMIIVALNPCISES